VVARLTAFQFSPNGHHIPLRGVVYLKITTHMNQKTNSTAFNPLIAGSGAEPKHVKAMTVIGRLNEGEGVEFVHVDAYDTADAERKFVAAVAEDYEYSIADIKARGYTIDTIVLGAVDYLFLRGSE
jgi:hypothetical protein